MTYEELLALAKEHTAYVKSILVELLRSSGPAPHLEAKLEAAHKKDKNHS